MPVKNQRVHPIDNLSADEVRARLETLYDLAFKDPETGQYDPEKDQNSDFIGNVCNVLVQDQAKGESTFDVKFPHEWWTPGHAKRSNREGWDMFTTTHTQEPVEVIEIERCDSTDDAADTAGVKPDRVPEWHSDAEVISAIIGSAAKGSKLHLLALYLDGRQSQIRCWVPPELRDADRQGDESLRIPDSGTNVDKLIDDAAHAIQGRLETSGGPGLSQDDLDTVKGVLSEFVKASSPTCPRSLADTAPVDLPKNPKEIPP